MMNDKENISPERFEQIDRYVLNQMKPEERSVFEDELEQDASLAKTVEAHRALVEAIEIQGLKDLMQTYHVQDNRKVVELHAKKERKFPFITYAIAASVAVLLFAFGALLFGKNPNQKLYAKYFKPDPGLPTLMSADEQDDNYKFNLGMVDYKLGNYNKALTQWKPLLKTHTDNDTLSYFLAMAHMANENLSAAKPHLLNLKDHTQSAFSNEIKYYLALIYLSEDQVPKAKELFIESNNEASKKILKELSEY